MKITTYAQILIWMYVKLLGPNILLNTYFGACVVKWLLVNVVFIVLCCRGMSNNRLGLCSLSAYPFPVRVWHHY